MTPDQRARAFRDRIMITAGMTVPFVAVYVDLRPDDTVEVLSVDFDRG